MLNKSFVFFLKVFMFVVLGVAFTACSNSSTSSVSKHSKSSSSSFGDKIVKSAKAYYGTKYKYGGVSKKGIDCSGLLYVVFKENGVTLPRVSKEQAKQGKAVYIGELKAGDLIFFGATDGSKKITHAGIVSYSDGKEIKFIHSSSSKGVMESGLAGYWKPKYIKARRVTK